ncbi:MAG: ABC transporter permease [Parachlamydia sp.]|jgi:oligopeptide transport system permease protein|nr:ABC transporter permease [Parachlamydia sp.]
MLSLKSNYSYFLKKALSLLCSLWIIATATFFLMKSIPGDPFAEEQALQADLHAQLMERKGLNKPLLVQYGDYLFSLLQGDLGLSLKYPGRTVNSIIKAHFPVSALLGLQAFTFALAGGLLLGLWSAVQRKGSLGVDLGLCMGLSLPGFLLAPLLQYLFAIQLGWLPLARWEGFWHTLLPSLSLAFMPAAFIARLFSSSLADVLETDYIKMAYAKGLPAWHLFFKHALKNAFLPLLPYLGPLMANLMVGSFIIEKIFAIPGLGTWFVLGVMNRDYALIMGLTLFYSSLLMVSIFIVDVLSGWLDPRLNWKPQQIEA